MKKQKYTPFSKKNIIYSRLEAYTFSLILIVMVWFEKDVSSISILLGLAWFGYKALQGLYIKLVEREHIEEIRQGRLREQLPTDDLDQEIEELDNKNIIDESEDYSDV